MIKVQGPLGIQVQDMRNIYPLVISLRAKHGL